MIVAADATILVRATKRADGPARRVIDAIIANPAHTLVLSEYSDAEHVLREFFSAMATFLMNQAGP